MAIDWNKISLKELKNNESLQKEYEKEFGLKSIKPETFDNNTKYVYQGFDPDIGIMEGGNSNIRLLGEICKTNYTDFKVKPRTHNKISCFRNLTKLQISIIIAELYGYRHYQVERFLGISSDEIKKELKKAVQIISKASIGRCKDCKWRAKGSHERKKDFCKYWKIKIRNNSYCWLYKEAKNGR